MSRSWISRLGALTLSLLILGGGSGLPVVDAVLHHLHGNVQVAGAHLSDPAGTSHAERCTLGAPLPTLVRPADVRPADLVSSLPVTSPVTWTSEPVTGPGCSLSQARAPPHSLG
jgi:hypothetical protein